MDSLSDNSRSGPQFNVQSRHTQLGPTVDQISSGGWWVFLHSVKR